MELNYSKKTEVAEPLRKFPTFMELEVSLPCSPQIPQLVPVLSQTNPIHTLTTYFCEIHFNDLVSLHDENVASELNEARLSVRFSHVF
jgi:hypothetical protein